jgi:hypothetical protein
MVARTTEELTLVDFDLGMRRVPDRGRQFLVATRTSFSFELCNETATFDRVPVNYWWIDAATLYGQRGGSDRNGQVMVEFYWASACEDAKRNSRIVEDDVIGSYVLAKLVPYARSNGSRRVFADAVLGAKRQLRAAQNQAITDLDAQLDTNRGEMVSMDEFSKATGAVLGHSKLSDKVWATYEAFQKELLEDTRGAFYRWGAAGLNAALAKWQKWMESIARRPGHENEKWALDILSYECRAAMHRCYSATWSALLPHLDQKYRLSDESWYFHRLWHFDIIWPSNDVRSLFHLFHGHVIALHPGIRLFTQTRNGGRLIGDYLRNDDRDLSFKRLLYGLMIALNHYAQQRDEQSSSRKKSPFLATYGDIESIHASQVSQSRSRRRKPARDDE